VLAVAIGVAGVLAGLLIETKASTQTPAQQETLGEAAPQPANAG